MTNVPNESYNLTAKFNYKWYLFIDIFLEIHVFNEKIISASLDMGKRALWLLCVSSLAFEIIA
jgi:hypothetical protein